MQKLLGLLALALAGTACQQQAPTTQTVAAAQAPPVRAVSQKTAVPAASLTLPTALTPAMRSLLKQCDLGALLQTVRPAGNSAMRDHALNGFFGPTHYRIEVVLTSVRRDERRLELYYLTGKTRYKKIITPFSGTLVIRQVLDQPTDTNSEPVGISGAAASNQPNLYIAVGDFVLREDSTHKSSGVFRGQFALDWSLATDGTLNQDYTSNSTLTQGGGTKYEGTWTKYGTSSPKAVVWVENLGSYNDIRGVLKDLEIGGRSDEISPKYAKLGWADYYENDEWWADAPQPTASL